MKKTVLIRSTILLAFTSIFSLAASAQVPSWQWAKTSSPTAGDNNYAQSVSTSGGNVYVVGYYTST
jgi:hypothetical protein